MKIQRTDQMYKHYYLVVFTLKESEIISSQDGNLRTSLLTIGEISIHWSSVEWQWY